MSHQFPSQREKMKNVISDVCLVQEFNNELGFDLEHNFKLQRSKNRFFLMRASSFHFMFENSVKFYASMILTRIFIVILRTRLFLEWCPSCITTISRIFLDKESNDGLFYLEHNLKASAIQITFSMRTPVIYCEFLKSRIFYAQI